MPAKRWVLIFAAAGIAACGSQTASGPAAVACRSSVLTGINLALGADMIVSALADSGCLSFAANPGPDSVGYLIVPQVTSEAPGDSFPFALTGGSAPPAAAAAVAARRAQHSPWARLRQMGPVALRFAHNLAQHRAATASHIRATMRRAPAAPVASPPAVGSERTFSVCADYNCDVYKAVSATVQAVGSHIAVYVDNTSPAPPSGLNTAQIDTLTGLFDTLYAIDTVAFGGVSDIDNNGVVIMLMTPVVNSLVTTAECYAGGYVAGYFNPIDLVTDSANSNDGEIFYTIVADPSGKYSCAHDLSDLEAAIPTTFLHELEHVICFNQHVLLRNGEEEDLWLDEALASYAEELGGRYFLPDSVTFSNYLINVVSDAYSYMQNPPRHFLLQESDTVLADFGAGWLYIRYMVDQFGSGITLKLEETNLTGTLNIATQTGVSFGTTAGQWALANYVSDLPGFTAPAPLRYTSWSFRAVFASLSQQDPLDFPVAFPLSPLTSPGTQLRTSGYLDDGSGAYVEALQGPLAAGFSMYLNGNGSAISPLSGPQLDVVRIR
ncbi:MAG TPA: hypothetical protein VN848_05620 [Gemmatimonadales bacterium]|nr:hypothetical protein [Gemmatimonadales bacterium]